MAIYIAIAGYEYEGSGPVGVFDNLKDCQAYIEKEIAETSHVRYDGGRQWSLQIWEMGQTKVSAGYWVDVSADGAIEWNYWDERLGKIERDEWLEKKGENHA